MPLSIFERGTHFAEPRHNVLRHTYWTVMDTSPGEGESERNRLVLEGALKSSPGAQGLLRPCLHHLHQVMISPRWWWFEHHHSLGDLGLSENVGLLSACQLSDIMLNLFLYVQMPSADTDEPGFEIKQICLVLWCHNSAPQTSKFVKARIDLTI